MLADRDKRISFYDKNDINLCNMAELSGWLVFLGYKIKVDKRFRMHLFNYVRQKNIYIFGHPFLNTTLNIFFFFGLLCSLIFSYH